jgi:rhamnogalacturonan hydrolase
MTFSQRLSVFFLLLSLAYTQLIGPVGTTTPLLEKKHECNVLDYGAIADNKTDIAGPLHLAFEQCVQKYSGSRLIIPQGEYLLHKAVVLSNAKNWAFQLDGLITAKFGGNWTIDRELVLQGYAGVEALNSTINGEGDNLFLLDLIVIVNGISKRKKSNKGSC